MYDACILRERETDRQRECVHELEGIRNFTEERSSKMCVTCLGTCQSLLMFACARVYIYQREREREISKASSVTKPEAF